MPLDSDGKLELVDPDMCQEIWHLWDLLNPEYNYGCAPFDIESNAHHFPHGLVVADTDDDGPALTFNLVARLAMPHLIHTINHLRDQLAMVDSMLDRRDGASLLKGQIEADLAHMQAERGDATAA